ncbi:DUF406 family protein [Pseudomonadota bacterium]|uniref:DUF406 family protein n=1 Tax=unclassified Shewanella TaxID=196818 RepID=UPI000C8334F6|nr:MULTISPECIES: DUF406 family protein [unclassified Shewanella]MDO6618388.1 DUF406 family protein [Shewanella sp. 6_MG-2023]MDO6640667.1 DUF406 family protein [Shewanella sp. 5_MG-2023]
MIKTITKQEVQVSDNCNDCGSFVDIGAVIEEEDTQLILQVDGENFQQIADDLVSKAKERFSNVKVQQQVTEQDAVVTFEFDVTVEKMIFQLENGL